LRQENGEKWPEMIAKGERTDERTDKRTDINTKKRGSKQIATA
jgi:hypothetical protein